MSHAFAGVTNRYIFDADTDIKFRMAPIKDVLEFLLSKPEVMLNLLERVYTGVNGVLGRMTHLMSSNARNRLIFEMLLEAKRFGTVLSDGKVDIQINEKDIGARSGLSRETVSREINKLKSSGAITIVDKRIKITNIDQLGLVLDEEF